MDNDKKTLILNRVQSTALPIFCLLACWFVYALLANPYKSRVQPPSMRQAVPAGIEYKTRPPLSDYLAVTQSREMFKPSVLYETKKSEVVNILGDLSFLGTVRGEGSIQALIMNKKSGQSSFFTSGQIIEDLEIKEIQDSKVVFLHGEETLELIR